MRDMPSRLIMAASSAPAAASGSVRRYRRHGHFRVSEATAPRKEPRKDVLVLSGQPAGATAPATHPRDPVPTTIRRRKLPPDLRQRGQSLVELALVLPIVMLLVMITIDFGRAFFGWISLNNMARVGANY